MNKSFSRLFLIMTVAVLAVVCFAFSAGAIYTDAPNCGENVWWDFNEQTGELVLSGSGDMNDYWYEYAPFQDERIKTVVIEEGITSIGASVFYNCTGITSISIPESLTRIGYYAFWNCSALEQIDLPESLTYIDLCCFMSCTSLKSIDIPGSVKRIENEAFVGCTSLEKVTMADGVESIAYSAFNGCTALSDIILPDSILSIESRAFENTAYYNDESNWENNVLYINNHLICANYHFSGDYSIKEGTVTLAQDAFGNVNFYNMFIPASVKGIGFSAFNSNSAVSFTVDEDNAYFTSDSRGVLYNKDKTVIIKYPASSEGDSYIIPDGVKTIGSSAFGSSCYLKEVVIPEGVTKIEHAAFGWSDSLESISIPDSVQLIENQVFQCCGKLESISIGSGLTRMYDDVFTDTAYYNNTSNWEDGVLYIGSCLITANEDVAEVCRIKEGTTLIADNAFIYSENLTHAIIPEGVANIGRCAFGYCPNLTALTIPVSVTNMDWAVVQGSENITDVYYNGKKSQWRELVPYEGDYGFENATVHFAVYEEPVAVETGTCGENISWTLYDDGKLVLSGSGDMAEYDEFMIKSPFSGRDDILSVEVKEGITSISPCAFYDCFKLSEVKLPDGITRIGYQAFEYTDFINDESNWKNNVLSINNYIVSADWYISGTCEIEEGTVLVAESAFSARQGLEKVAIPSSVKYVGNGAFAGCENLKEVVISEGLEKIDDHTFRDCYSLETVTIPSSVKSIGEGGFFSCENLKTVNYTGMQDQWKSVSVGEYNECLTEAIFIYADGCAHENLIVLESIAATCTEEGLTEGKKCSDCGEVTVAQETVPAKGHKETTLKAVASTCTKAGKTAGKKCSVCGTITVAQKTVKAKGHTLTTLKAVSATCTKTGKTAGKKCSTCGTVTVKQKTVAKKAHTYKEIITKATLTKNGKITRKCSACGYTASKVTTIYAVKSVKLSTYTYTYAGKVRTPVVTVKDSKGKTLKKDTDYTVKYATGRKMPGKYTVTITFKGKYSGKKTLSFKINPAAPKVTKATSTKKGIASLTWSNVTGETGYEVYFSTKKSSGFKKLGTYKVNVVKATKSKLTSGKTYYFKVRAYKTTSSGNVYSAYSPVKAVKIK